MITGSLTIYQKRTHPLYHYGLVPASLLLIVLAFVDVFAYGVSLHGLMLMGGAIVLHLTVFLTREYAKRNQDRIIRVELRLRYFVITGESFTNKEQALNTAQLIALRFASDKQLVELINQTISEHLDPIQIKNKIENGEPDRMRV